MKTILITGVGRGIGKALAQKFLKEEWFVIGTSVTGAVDYADPNLIIYPLDLSLSESVLSCAEEIKKSNRTLDLVINNAGVLLDEEETVVIPDKLRQTLEINLIGPIDFTERVLEIVKEGGHIVNISSSAGSLEAVGDQRSVLHSHHEGRYPAYKISKAALNMYTRTLALRLRGKVTVSSVHPGWVKTDMGGNEASITPQAAAETVYSFAISNPETGQFWFSGKKISW